LHAGLEKVLQENNIAFTINRIGSMISIHFDESPVVDFKSAAKGDNELFKVFSWYVASRYLKHLLLMNLGLSPRFDI
jgi:glutamate-1-semialdehyde aminotransferase